MALITIPSAGISSVQFSLMRHDRALDLLGGGGEVIVAPPASARWLATVKLDMLNRADAAEWQAFLVQMNKLSNYCQLAPPGQTGPRSGYTGANPLVNGAGQTGVSLICDGATVSTSVLKRADYFLVNNEFKMSLNDETSNGTGQLTIEFEPALRESPGDNYTVNVKTPKVNMRLASPLAIWSIDPAVFFDIELSFMEVFL